jgi:mono/diheme cytochrome c family protein
MSPILYRSARPVIIAVLIGASACSLPGRFMRGYATAEASGTDVLDRGGIMEEATEPHRGQVRFVFDDFGSLTTDELESYAIPWKLAATSLALGREEAGRGELSQSRMRAVLREYGFLTPTRIANWAGPQPHLDRPLGLVGGTARRGFPGVEIEIANVGCATCHAGPVYGADGRPTGEAWLGLPNPSVDLTSYVADVTTSLARDLDRPDVLLEAVTRAFPETSARELSTLRKHVIPRAREQLAERMSQYGGLLPFDNGGAGLMNGVGSIRFLIGLIHQDVRSTEVAYTSPPDLTGTTLRRTLLIDGVYAAPGSSRYGGFRPEDVTSEHLDDLAGVTSIFIAGTQGISPADSRKAIPEVREVMAFINELGTPAFPGVVDPELAREGGEVYQGHCASCHGTYREIDGRQTLVEHANRFVPQDRMRTDSTRWTVADSLSLRLIQAIGYGELIEPVGEAGYIAPDLSGVWATAPYLHNGSVPTLWHLLYPDARPERFWVGGHKLDLDLVGIAGFAAGDGTWCYPAEYRPWSRPTLFDTRTPGRSNEGHGFYDLDDRQRLAVLEYMKTL